MSAWRLEARIAAKLAAKRHLTHKPAEKLMRLSDKDLEIVDLKGRINSLEILGKRYQTALRKIVSDGDYTAPEGMKRIAAQALAPQSDAGVAE